MAAQLRFEADKNLATLGFLQLKPGTLGGQPDSRVVTMNQEHVDEWSSLMDRALAAVRTGANLRERGTRRLFQIVVVPAFDSAASWEIFELKTRANGTSHDIVV